MKKLLIIILTVFTGFLLMSFANRIYVKYWATVYVDTGGNDNTGTGAIGNPYKTLFKATSVTNSGNIIHLNAGTYTETQTSILAPGVSIEGDGVTSILKSSFSTIYKAIIECNSNENTDGNQHISNLKLDGNNSTSWGIQIAGRKNFSIYNCTFNGTKQRAVIWGGRGNNSPETKSGGGTGPNADGPPLIYTTGNSFHDNIMTNCSGFNDAGGAYGYGCINIGGQDGMLIYNNSIINSNIAGGGPSNTPGWPIKLWNDGHLKGCKIYNNTLKRPAFPYATNGDNSYFDFCIEMFYEEGLEIYGNTIEGSIDLNYQSKGSYAYSTYIHDNIIGYATATAHWETGIWLEEYTGDAKIEDNTFKNLSSVIFFSLRPLSYMNNIYISNNLAYGIGSTDGLRRGSFITMQVNDDSKNYSASNFQVFNNTAICATGTSSPSFVATIPGGNSSTGVVFKNNVFQGAHDYVMTCDYGTHLTGFQLLNNNLYLNGNSNTIQWNVGTPSYTSTANQVGTNPNLNAVSNAYTPNTGSPLINAGSDGTDIGYTGGQAVVTPTVTSTTPAPNITGVSVNVRPTITFSTTLNPATVTTGNITLKRGITPVTINVSYSSGVVTITPTSDLLNNTLYTVNITTGITDSDGVAMASPFTFNFTTANAGNIIKRNYLIVPKRN